MKINRDTNTFETKGEPIQARIDKAVHDLQEAIERNKITHLSASISGGHDSVLAAYIAYLAAPAKFRVCVYANTMTGARETRQYITDITDHYGWRLESEKPPQKGRYDQLVITWGFPSPAFHSVMYRELKGKLLDKVQARLAREFGIKKQFMGQVTGLRKAESQRRNSFVELELLKKDKNGRVTNVLLNPIWDWHIVERDDAIKHLNIPRNPYADKMKHSYECMCYANMAVGERELRAVVSPEYEEIERLREELVAKAYELQLQYVRAGVWEAEDMTLKPERLKQGWHLKTVITDEDLNDQDPFNLCQSCIGKRAPDGTGAKLDLDDKPDGLTWDEYFTILTEAEKQHEK